MACFINSSQQISPIVVYLVQGGTAEDLCLTPCLQFDEKVRLQNVTIVSADCHGPTAMKVTQLISSYLHSPDVPTYLSQARAQNPFPWEWRGDCIEIEKLLFQDFFTKGSDCQDYSYPSLPAEEQLGLMLADEDDHSVSLLVTCPLAPLEEVFTKNKNLVKKIKQMICMGGTFDKGNIFPEVVGGLQRPFSEWNMFWYPKSVDVFFKNTTIPLTLIPIEACEELKLTEDFFHNLRSQSKNSLLSGLALRIYELVQKQPAYRLWNSAALQCLLHPSICSIEKRRVVIETDPYSEKEGALEKREDGREISVVTEINTNLFYKYYLESLNKQEKPN